MMAQVARDVLVDSAPYVPVIRRFQLPDLDRHPWLIERFRLAHPHMPDPMIRSWLRGIIYSNEFLFLYQDHAVALAQTLTPNLAPKSILVERFCWAEDPRNPEYVALAAGFYEEFGRYAKQKGIEEITVEVLTDVPHEDIKARLGRLFTQQRTFARV